MNILIAQIIGMAGVIVIVGSVQFKKKKDIMLMQLIANILYAFQYTLLKAYSASSMNILAVFRCYIVYKYEKTNKKIPVLFPIILCALIIIIGALNYTGYLSLIPIIITLAYTISSFIKDPKIFKITFLCCSFLWLYYNLNVQAYASFAGNIFEIISTSIALKNNKKKK